MKMKLRIPRYFPFVLAVLLAVFACSEDSSVNPNHPAGELIIDSVSVYVVRGVDPYSGNPAGKFAIDLYFELIGNPGAIYRIEFSPSPPGTNTLGLERPGYYLADPLPIDTHLEYHEEDLWFEYDYTDYDSIWTYCAVTAIFWNEYESHIRDETIHIPLGEDKKWFVLMIDVRDE